MISNAPRATQNARQLAREITPEIISQDVRIPADCLGTHVTPLQSLKGGALRQPILCPTRRLSFDRHPEEGDSCIVSVELHTQLRQTQARPQTIQTRTNTNITNSPGLWPTACQTMSNLPLTKETYHLPCRLGCLQSQTKSVGQTFLTNYTTLAERSMSLIGFLPHRCPITSKKMPKKLLS